MTTCAKKQCMVVVPGGGPCPVHTCRASECDRLIRCKGLCAQHGRATCEVDGCDKTVVRQGRCYAHGRTTCAADGCEELSTRTEFCVTHARENGIGWCVIDGCEKRSDRRGLCKKHLKQAAGKCCVEGCSERLYKLTGKCLEHSMCADEASPPPAEEIRRLKRARDGPFICEVDDCDHECIGQERWCWIHRHKVGVCATEGCAGRYLRHELCRTCLEARAAELTAQDGIQRRIGPCGSMVHVCIVSGCQLRAALGSTCKRHQE